MGGGVRRGKRIRNLEGYGGILGEILWYLSSVVVHRPMTRGVSVDCEHRYNYITNSPRRRLKPIGPI